MEGGRKKERERDTHTHQRDTYLAQTLLPLLLDHQGFTKLVHLIQVLGPGDPDIRQLAANNCSATRNSELSRLICTNATTDSIAHQVAELEKLSQPAPPDSPSELCLRYKPPSTQQQL